MRHRLDDSGDPHRPPCKWGTCGECTNCKGCEMGSVQIRFTDECEGSGAEVENLPGARHTDCEKCGAWVAIKTRTEGGNRIARLVAHPAAKVKQEAA